jgi:nicotinate dehydrogenase subunit B
LLQALSWTLFERVTFDRTRVTSVDWSAYPILRFGDVPHSIEVHIIDCPGDGFFGVAEAAQGPSGAALANAIRNATGLRLYELPFTAQRIREAGADIPGANSSGALNLRSLPSERATVPISR